MTAAAVLGDQALAEERRHALAILHHIRRFIEWDDERFTPSEWIALIMDTIDDAETIVAEHGDELADLTEIDRTALLRWVTLVRPDVLEELAYDMNHAEAWMGGSQVWVVHAGKVVTEDRVDVVNGWLRERAPRRPPAVIVRPLLRMRRGRAPRGRRVTRRSSARASGRPADDDPEADVARRAA